MYLQIKKYIYIYIGSEQSDQEVKEGTRPHINSESLRKSEPV